MKIVEPVHSLLLVTCYTKKSHFLGSFGAVRTIQCSSYDTVTSDQHALHVPHCPSFCGAPQSVPSGVTVCTFDAVIPGMPRRLRGIRTWTSGYIADKRMIKLVGTDLCFAINSLTYPYSLVGSQCLQFGVARATWAIISRWVNEAKSPESCQRK